MRCPKCQYVGFDGHSKCRNCGYDLSLAETADVRPPAPASEDTLEVPESSARAQARAAIQKRAASRTPGPDLFDLPLFATPGAENRPIVTPPAAPRPPLAVRRGTSEPARGRSPAAGAAPLAPGPDTEEARLELDLVPPAAPAAPVPDVPVTRDDERLHAGEPVPDEPAATDDPPAVPDVSWAGTGARAVAGLIDLALLAALDAAVVAATLRVTGLRTDEVARLPLAPLVVFFVLLAVGYLAMCAVLSGQTAGKMLMGIKVVETGGRNVRFGAAVVRAGLQVITVPLLGLGFLPALLGTDPRALYDRVAGTKVIRLNG